MPPASLAAPFELDGALGAAARGTPYEPHRGVSTEPPR